MVPVGSAEKGQFLIINTTEVSLPIQVPASDYKLENALDPAKKVKNSLAPSAAAAASLFVPPPS